MVTVTFSNDTIKLEATLEKNVIKSDTAPFDQTNV